jgi:integrase
MPRQEQGIEYYLTQSGEKRYRVRWEEEGRHRSRSFRRLSGAQGARRFYQRVREVQESGGRLVKASGEPLTLAEFVADVWAPRAKRRLAVNTWKRDSNVYNNHILHQLGANPIAEIDAEVLVQWQDDLEESGVGDPTQIKAMTILSSIFREAARRPRATGVKVNPVALLDKPSAKRRRRPRVWGPVVVERVRYQLIVNSRRIEPQKEINALMDALLVSFGEMIGCRPGEALATRLADVGRRVEIASALSGDEIVERTKTVDGRIAPVPAPLEADVAALRKTRGDGPDDFIFRPYEREHWVETDWRNFRARHFIPALERVEAEWHDWRESLPDPDVVRESVVGLAKTRPYDLGRHTHSSLMLAGGMTLQRLARIQGHSIRVLDETYAEQLAEYEERNEPIDPVAEIEAARRLVWRGLDPATGRPKSGPELR